MITLQEGNNLLNAQITKQLSYEIINPRFNLDGMNLTFKNNTVPQVDVTSNDHPNAPVYIRFRIEVDRIVPRIDSDYNEDWTTEIFDYMPYDNPNQIPVPAPGTSVNLFLSFMENDVDNPFNMLRNLISRGYVDPNISQIRIKYITFDNYYDWSGGYSSYMVIPGNPPTLPIVVNRT
jgi:hypothetical protein